MFQRDSAQAGLRGAPLAGVRVAVEMGARVEQMTTDAAGAVHVRLPADVGEVTLTAAKEGWLPVATIYRATVAEIEAEVARPGGLYVLMEPPAAAPQSVSVTVIAGVPFCVSGTVWEACSAAGYLTTLVPRSADPVPLTAYSTDADGCPVELKEVTLPDALAVRTVTIAFDGTGRKDPTLVPLFARLPDDPASSMRSFGMMQRARFPLLILDPAQTRIVGGACRKHLSQDGMMLEMQVAWFPVAGEEPAFIFLFFPDTPGSHNGDLMEFSAHRLPAAPVAGATYTAMDTPRTSLVAPNLSSSFLTR